LKHNLVAVGLLAGALVSSHAADSHAKVVKKVKYRGQTATLALFHETEISCEGGSSGLLDTSLTMELYEDGVDSGYGYSEEPAILLFFSQYSTCTGISRDFVAFDEPAQYTQQHVQSASFADSFEMIDEYTGEPIGTLTFDVLLTGIGQTNHSNTHTSWTSGDFTFETHFNGSSREATATGTVNLDGVELINSSQFATLSDLHTAVKTVTH